MRNGLLVRTAVAVSIAGGLIARDALQSQTQNGTLGSRAAEETIHGERVPDPFRGLEDGASAATTKWLAGQRELLDRTIGAAEVRNRLRQRLAELVRYDSYTTPAVAGGTYFYTRLDAGQPQSATRVICRTADGAERELVGALAPGELLNGLKPSPDGTLLALSRSNPTTGVNALRIVRTTDGKALPDGIDSTAGPLSMPEWLPDGSGFYYAAPEVTAPGGAASISHYRLFFHRVGDKRDAVVSELPADRGLLVTPRVTADGRYLVITLQRGSETRNRVLLQTLVGQAGKETARDLVPAWESAFTYLGSDGSLLWFYTDAAAPRGRIVAIDARRPERAQWREVVSQQPETISARDQTGVNPLGMYGGRVLLTYLRDGQPFFRVLSREGRLLHTVTLPPAGSIWGGFSGTPSSNEVFYRFLGLTDPGAIYRLDLTTGGTSVFVQPRVPFDGSRYVVKQDFYRSADGTRIPIFVAHRADLEIGSGAPAWLYGYGALGWVSFIWYQPHILAWLEMGGVYAQPSLRGGGEYGEEWHQAALKTRKTKAVDDYVAAAEWLIARGYTTSARLAANGGSLSAPLVAAAVERRPDLFGAAIIDRPVTDMVRYERFTGGTFWSPEFGSIENPDEFRSLLSLSAYHNALKAGCRPPTLILAGELDRTAPPLHARKLTAALQASQTCANPIVLKMMAGATHNFGNTPEQQVDSFGDLLAFLATVFKL